MPLFSKEKLNSVLKKVTKKKRQTLLVVDDELSNLKVLSAALENDYHLLKAQNGEQALAIIRQLPDPEIVRVVISDQRMPRMTGVELFEHLEHEIPKALRIIVTGFIEVNTIIDAVNKTHIYSFILKPFERSELQEIVKRALDVYEMRHSLEQNVSHLEETVMQQSAELAKKQVLLANAYEQLEQESIFDTATGIKNHRFVADFFNQSSTQTKQFEATFYLVEMNEFTQIQAQYDEKITNELLHSFISILKQTFTTHDQIIRWQAHQFLIIATHDPVLSENYANRLCEQVKATQLSLGEEQYLTYSCAVGFSRYPFIKHFPEYFDWHAVVNMSSYCTQIAKNTQPNSWVTLQANDVIENPNVLDDLPNVLQQKIQEKYLFIYHSWTNAQLTQYD